MAAEPVRVIFDTDMGNDIDDAVALAMLHSFVSRGEAELLAVTVTKALSHWHSSMRASAASTACTGETSRLAMAAASARVSRSAMALLMAFPHNGGLHHGGLRACAWVA